MHLLVLLLLLLSFTPFSFFKSDGSCPISERNEPDESADAGQPLKTFLPDSPLCIFDFFLFFSVAFVQLQRQMGILPNDGEKKTGKETCD